MIRRDHLATDDKVRRGLKRPRSDKTGQHDLRRQFRSVMLHTDPALLKLEIWSENSKGVSVGPGTVVVALPHRQALAAEGISWNEFARRSDLSDAVYACACKVFLSSWW